MEIPLLADLLIVFALALIVMFACHRLRIPAIVGFLITGMVAGPHGLALIGSAHEHELHVLAEIGVALLLFTIGIEFSLEELLKARRWVLFGGAGQVVLTFVLSAAVTRGFGQPIGLAVLVGFAVALSSTAIVLKTLQERACMESPHGRAILAILIFQDLIIVPMVLVVPVLAGETEDVVGSLALLLGKAALVTVLVFVAARRLVPLVLYQVARLRDRELFLLGVVVIVFGIMWLTSSVGLSLALGAFLAGLIISESEYSHRALGEVLPFRDVFTSLFFISVGMLLDLGYVARHPVLVLAIAVAVLGAKAILAGSVGLFLGLPLRTAILVGLGLAQVGEFSFVLMQTGRDSGLLAGDFYQMFLGVTVFTMIATPFVIAGSPRVADLALRFAPLGRLRRDVPAAESATAKPRRKDHLVIVGFGLNGHNLVRAASAADIDHVVIELNADTVRRERAAGRPILYGDATQPAVLEYAGVDTARIVVVAISDPVATRRIVELARSRNPRATIIARTRFTSEINELLQLGADDVIPEEFETSVEIFTRVLAHYLVPQQDIERFVAEVRNENYGMFRSLPSRAAPSDLKLHMPEIEVMAFRVEENSSLVGKSPAELELRRKHAVTLLAIRRDSQLLANPAGDVRLDSGDLLILVGKPENLRSFAVEFQ